MAVSLQATVLPIIVITVGMWIAYSVGGELYVGAVVAAVLLSMASIVVAVNSYDPFIDNADGIAGVAELAHEVRTITDALDAVGHTSRPVEMAPDGQLGHSDGSMNMADGSVTGRSPSGLLHPHDGRQAVLPCDHRAMGHQAPHLSHQARDRDEQRRPTGVRVGGDQEGDTGDESAVQLALEA